MLRHRILVVSSEANMRRSLKRLMTATGAVTEFVNDLARLPADAPSLRRRAPRSTWRCARCRSTSAPPSS